MMIDMELRESLYTGGLTPFILIAAYDKSGINKTIRSRLID